MVLAPSALERATLDAALERAASSDKAQLKRLGAVHTPPALVHFALRRIERALRADFALSAGLASEQVQILDPAVGTGIWLSALLSQLSGRGAPSALLGFETDKEVLETARALLVPAAGAQGVPLTLLHENTLTLASPWPAGDRVRVVLGNPPWGARSLSRGLRLNDAWLRDFRADHEGKPLRERRTGVLSDDYVRFFRWALEQARTAPRGALVCFLTNSSYLDGPVHRGMRAQLVSCFDRIETFDLGGGSLRSRAVQVDEPLFPVRVGAALSLCVRGPRSAPQRAHVSYLRIEGTRAQKLASLEQLSETARVFLPEAPWFRLTPAREDGDLSAGFGLDEAFPFHAEGVQTNRDALATDSDASALFARLGQIARGELALRASPHFDPGRVRALLGASLANEPSTLIATLAYRPWEARFYCKLTALCHRPRPLLARAVDASELCLLSARKEPGGAAWNMFALSRTIADSSFLSVRSSCRTRVFPSHDALGAPNLDARVQERIAQQIGRPASVRELMLYAVGLLGSARYRAEHAHRFKLNYPRIPWPRDRSSFEQSQSAGALFWDALTARSVSKYTLSLNSERAPSERVLRRTLRWLSPYQLELCSGTWIGAGNARPFRASVGHHEIVARAYRRDGSATIAEVLEACERATMWVEAERAADEAYQLASSVRRTAKVIAVED